MVTTLTKQEKEIVLALKETRIEELEWATKYCEKNGPYTKLLIEQLQDLEELLK